MHSKGFTGPARERSHTQLASRYRYGFIEPAKEKSHGLLAHTRVAPKALARERDHRPLNSTPKGGSVGTCNGKEPL